MFRRRQFIGGVGAAGLAVCAGCLGGTEPTYQGESAPGTKWWSQPQFDTIGSCYNPTSVGPRTGVRERWQLDISGPAARPVVADGLAFLPTATAVRAVDARTGKEQWRETGDETSLWPRVVCWHKGTLYVGLSSGDPALLALDAKTGKRQWTFTPDGYGVHALLLDSEFSELFAGDGAGNVYRLDPKTGERQWQRRVFGKIAAFVRGIPELLVATEAGEVYALSADDGRGYWRRKLPGRIGSLAAMYGGYNGAGVFVSVFGGPTFALNPSRTGATVWKTDVWSSDSFVLSGESLFTAGHRLVSLGVGSGKRRWRGGKTSQCGPAAAGDTVYAASEDSITAYKFGGGIGIDSARIGARRWSHSVTGRPEQGLAVADGAAFVLTEGSDSSKAYALEEA